MTAKEARKAANAFNSIKDDIIYKKIKEAIEERASKGEYWVIVIFLIMSLILLYLYPLYPLKKE